jgi:Secretory lipase
MCHLVRSRRHLGVCLSTFLLVLVWAMLAVPGARAAVPPEQDPFYTYSGPTPLANIAPGTVLKTRVLPYHVAGFPTLVSTVQLLYRSTGQLGQPTTNVTSVLLPPPHFGPPTVLSYQSLYDSLNRNDEPSYAISGGLTLGGLLPTVESALIVPALLAGETVVVPDTEGQTADFSAGAEYAFNTLDSLRAALSSPATGLNGARKIGLLGYSGGAIATEWAAELAPSYAPDVNSRIIGAAIGGVLVDPAHNLHYTDGSLIWAGVTPMALIGSGRAFGGDLSPYLNEFGLALFKKLQKASIAEVLGAYPGLTFAQLAKPQYQVPESIPVYVKAVNQQIMGTHGTPTTPLFIGQGTGGELEGTPGNKPGIGKGDGVMIAGDVRTLAREFCSRGVAVQYNQYEGLSHIGSALVWLPQAAAWLTSRFIGFPAPQDCAQIAPGNSLAPIP